MECLKGTIQKMAGQLMLVEILLSGHHFWFKATPTSRVCRSVLVAWDWTKDEPRDIFTKDDLEVRLGISGESEFSPPRFSEEVFEEDAVTEETPVPPEDFWWYKDGVSVEAESESEFMSFLSPEL